MRQSRKNLSVVWELSPVPDYRETLRKALRIILDDSPHPEREGAFDEILFARQYEPEAEAPPSQKKGRESDV